MLDLQYTLEKLAEYRELGLRVESVDADESMAGSTRWKKVRYSFLAVLSTFLGK
ncbi:hypothetical protein ACFSR7_21980 [Cohnella sp. GCM10020058]|uniref:hypothetical protein n=1 Tax=Cohnella sp. GCM10020058 TaxID=3317330 RepID=UPI0036277624